MRERFTAVEGCVKGVAFSDGHGFVCSRGHETKHVLVRHLFDLAAHLEDVFLGLDDVGARHQEERIRRLSGKRRVNRGCQQWLVCRWKATTRILENGAG